LRTNLQVPIFKSVVGWRPKKVPKVPFFWLRWNTAPKATQSKPSANF